MSTTYRAAIRTGLPHATVVVDHFHVVQLANKMERRLCTSGFPTMCLELWFCWVEGVHLELDVGQEVDSNPRRPLRNDRS